MDTDKVIKVVFLKEYKDVHGDIYAPGDRAVLPADIVKQLFNSGVVTLAKLAN